ncbi:hypothetical protein Goari_027351, partial [Gossypium aridum]|nr:hypothetical protein [Gossypium aridum]
PLAKGLLHKGLCWRVGTGTSISVLGDSWVLESTSYKIQDGVKNQNVQTVADLVDPNIRRWKRNYSVRSSYKLLIQGFRNPTPRQNFIPAFSNLHYRRLMNTARCPRCDDDAETLLHMLRDCKITKEKGPKDACIKVNFDAAYCQREAISCSGILLRDQRGNVIASKIACHESIPSPFAAEAVACTVAMKLCLDLGLRILEVEGDSLTVIKKAKSNEDDRSEISAYIEDMKKMTKDFQVCTFKHVQRSANGVAHQLVSEGLKLKLAFFESNGVLDFVEELVEQDRCREKGGSSARCFQRNRRVFAR